MCAISYKLIIISILFLGMTVCPLASAAAEEKNDIVINLNNSAAKAITLIEEAKRLLSLQEDRSQISTLNLVQRNLARKYIVLYRYKINREKKIENFLDGTIYKRGRSGMTPVKIFQRKKEKTGDQETALQEPKNKRGTLQKLQRKLSHGQEKK